MENITPQLDDLIAHYSIQVVLIAIVLLVILTVISLKIKVISPAVKKLLFGLIVLTVVLSTVFLAGSTIYLNTHSVSLGPVHYHADFEIWACGQEIDLKDPSGLSNKIGTPTLHEHNDKRIHLEGVVVNKNSASLGNFFYVVGGSISSNSITIPTNTGTHTYASGSPCPNGTIGQLQVFTYKAQEDHTYFQQKLTDPANYTISPYTNVPPGDCIIIEFNTPKLRTDKLCRSYKVAKQIGKLGEEIEYHGN